SVLPNTIQSTALVRGSSVKYGRQCHRNRGVPAPYEFLAPKREGLHTAPWQRYASRKPCLQLAYLCHGANSWGSDSSSMEDCASSASAFAYNLFQDNAFLHLRLYATNIASAYPKLPGRRSRAVRAMTRTDNAPTFSTNCSSFSVSP